MIEDEMVRFSFEDEIDPLKIEDHEMDPPRLEDTMNLIMELSKEREEITRIDLRNWPNDGTLIVPDRTFFEPGRRVGIFESYWRMPVKKAVLIGLKHPRINNTDVKEKILRLKVKLMELRGFPEDTITLMMEDQEEEEPSRKSLQPTDFNMRRTLFSLIHSARPGDILYIHLIAYGCSDGRIITSDKYHIEDSFFRNLIAVACDIKCKLTLVSDCLIEPAVCSCKERIPALIQTFGGPDVNFEEARKKFMEYHDREREVCIFDMKSMQPTNLPYVDILNIDILNTPNEEKKKDDGGSHSGVILLTPFRPVQNAATVPNPFDNVSELFILPPNRLTNHTSYGVLTDAVLDVFEETHGQFTSLGLAQKAMKEIGGGITPTLRCSDHNLAYTSFLC